MSYQLEDNPPGWCRRVVTVDGVPRYGRWPIVLPGERNLENKRCNCYNNAAGEEQPRQLCAISYSSWGLFLDPHGVVKRGAEGLAVADMYKECRRRG